MGYLIYQNGAKFEMAEKDAPLALEALKKVFVPNKGTVRDSGGMHFRWIRAEDVQEAKTFEEAMRACRYWMDGPYNGKYEYISFEGEKYGDDGYVFNAIAPFVKEGSYVAFRGEDGILWKWQFHNGKATRVEGHIEYDESDLEYDFSKYTMADICNDLFNFIDTETLTGQEQKIKEALQTQFYALCKKS